MSLRRMHAGLDPRMARFAAGAGASSLGTGVFAATATIYFVTRAGLTARLVGLALSAGAVVGLLAVGGIGRLADRAGVRPVLVGVLLVRAVGYGSLAAARSPAAIVALLALGVAGDQVTPPLQQALTGELVDKERRTAAMGALRAVRNVGLTAGFAAGGAVLATGSAAAFRWALAANGLSFVVLAAVVATLPLAGAATARAARADAGAPATRASRPAMSNRPFLGATALNGVLLLHDSLLVVLLPLWVVDRTDLPSSLVSVFLAVNTVCTVALQVLLPRLPLGRSWSRALPVAGGSLACACGAFALAAWCGGGAGLALAAVAVLLLTWGENVHAVAAWAFSYDAAPPDRTAEYLGVFATGAGTKSIVGPLLMTAVVLPAGPAGWALLAALFAAAGLGCRPLGTAALTATAVVPDPVEVAV